jgi:SAM-dependent methyltransferase
MTGPVDRAAQAASFGVAAEQYERGRPPYPPEALDWLVPPGARRVLDLGAGTGKLTRGLVARGLDVTAVEPSAGMRARLTAALPQVTALAGTAEAIPLPDAGVDAVLVAQAWHWVDPARAVPEAARVLVPGGRLGMVWNVRDERVPWVAALTHLLERHSDPGPELAVPEVGAPFRPMERVRLAWVHRVSRQQVVDLVASRSYVITMPPAAREQLLQDVRHLLLSHPDLTGHPDVALPYLTHCYRTGKG